MKYLLTGLPFVFPSSLFWCIHMIRYDMMYDMIYDICYMIYDMI